MSRVRDDLGRDVFRGSAEGPGFVSGRDKLGEAEINQSNVTYK